MGAISCVPLVSTSELHELDCRRPGLVAGAPRCRPTMARCCSKGLVAGGAALLPENVALSPQIVVLLLRNVALLWSSRAEKNPGVIPHNAEVFAGHVSFRWIVESVWAP